MQVLPVITKELNFMAHYLTPTEQDVLDAINMLYEGAGVLPKNKEIADKYSEIRKSRGKDDSDVGRSFIAQYLQRLHDKGHIRYEDGLVRAVNVSNTLNINYVFEKLEWLAGEYKAGRLTQEEYNKYKRLLDQKL